MRSIVLKITFFSMVLYSEQDNFEQDLAIWNRVLSNGTLKNRMTIGTLHRGSKSWSLRYSNSYVFKHLIFNLIFLFQSQQLDAHVSNCHALCRHKTCSFRTKKAELKKHEDSCELRILPCPECKERMQVRNCRNSQTINTFKGWPLRPKCFFQNSTLGRKQHCDTLLKKEILLF